MCCAHLPTLPGCCRGAYAALSQYTRQTIADLQCDDDEMLKGVDWRAVSAAADVLNDKKTKVVRPILG